MNPLISVILPVYNSCSSLPASLKSILDQTYRNMEIIIIDDGSIDRTHVSIGGFEDNRIQYHRKEHNGLAASLNYGLAQSRGTFIARMDADDISLPERLQQQALFLKNHPDIDLIATQVRYEGPENSVGIRHYIDWQNRLTTPLAIYNNRFIDSPVVHPTIMARRSCFEKFGSYSEKKGPEDFELWLRWLHQGARFAKLEEQLLIWKDHPARLTRTGNNYQRVKFFELKAEYFVQWFKNTFDLTPKVWIIGAGRTIYQRVSWLERNGIEIEGYVDFNRSSTDSKRKIISYSDIKSLENPFFLSYVSDRKGKMEIRKFLLGAGYAEGKDFYLMA